MASPDAAEAPGYDRRLVGEASRLLPQRLELFEADDVAAEALRGGGAEVAYELRRLLGRAEHPEISVALEHAVELFADEVLRRSLATPPASWCPPRLDRRPLRRCRKAHLRGPERG